MIREVELAAYLPPFMQVYKELVAALKAEDPEFHMLWEESERIFHNRFISTADEYGISRREKMLKIFPQDTDSLALRRMRIQNRWVNSVPYTKRVMEDKLAECLGGKQNFSLEPDFVNSYGLTVIVYSTDESQAEEVQYLLSTMVPDNIRTEIIYEKVTSSLAVYFGAFAEQVDIIDLRQR